MLELQKWRRSRGRIAALAIVLATQSACPANEPVALQKAEIRSTELEAIVDALCDEQMRGRQAATLEELLAADYIAEAFHGAELVGGGDDGSFLQKFPVRVVTGMGAGSELRNRGRRLRLGIDWRPVAASTNKTVLPSGAVWAGYGIVAPPSTSHSGRNDFGEEPVEGRWVIVRAGMPNDLSAEDASYLRRFATLEAKLQQARARGAVGLLLALDAVDLAHDTPLFIGPSHADNDIAVAALSTGALHELVAAASPAIRASVEAAQGSHQAVPIPNVEIDAHIDLESEYRDGHNVLGILSASDARASGGKSRPLVIGAHYDHLGMGGPESYSRAPKEDAIHPGANDNASGVAALIAVARSLAARLETGALVPQRDIVFAAWSGEEIGGRPGSRRFAGKERKRRYASYVNMDMVGRLASLQVRGVGSSLGWRSLVNRARVAAPDAPNFELIERDVVPSDVETFEYHCTPWLWFFDNERTDWHTPRDVPDELSYEQIAGVARVVAALTEIVAEETTELDFVPANPANPPPCAGE